MGKLIVSLSPHAHGTDTVERNMYGVIIALLPALLVSFYFFGLGSVVVLSTSVAACVLLEWAINKFMLKNPRNTVLDGSAVLTGLLLGFNLPSNLPIWIIIIGAIFAIGFAKMPFGGLGNNLFNPALVGRAALLVAFPAQMTTWPKVGQLGSYLDAETGATPLAVMKNAIKTGDASVLDQLPSSLDLFLGNHPDGAGAMGEICALALLIGLAYMLWKKIITWHIPISIIGTVFVFAGLLHLANPAYADRLINLIEMYGLYVYDRQDQKYTAHNIGVKQDVKASQHSFRKVGGTNRTVVQNNGLFCVIVQPGDSWEKLAHEMNVKVKKLLKWNEAFSYTPLYVGNYVYLQKKAKKGPREMKKKWHKVSSGESMYFISQYYGVRLEKLYRMNFKSVDFVPQPGDLIKVR